MTTLFYTLISAIVLFIMLFIFMYLSYKHFVQKIEKQRRENVQSIIEAQERERRTIALEVHDNLGPLLSITNMQVEALMIERGNENIDIELQDIHKQIKHAVDICRDISHELTPFLNNKVGLVQMIHEYLQKINTAGKIQAQYSCNIEYVVIPQQKAASICRIILELLTNTIKHAEAQYANIDIAVKNAQFILIYTDDGKGIQKETSSGIGMKNIQSRVELLNGYLQIVQPSIKGIKVIIKIPIKEFEEQ